MKSKIYKEPERGIFTLSFKGITICLISTIALLYLFVAFKASNSLDSFEHTTVSGIELVSGIRSSSKKGSNNLRSFNPNIDSTIFSKDFGPKIQDTSSLNKLLNPIKDYRPMKNLTIFPDVVKEALFQSKTSLEKEKGGGSKPAQPDIKEDKPKSALDLKIIPVALKLPKKKLSKPTQPPQPAAIVLDISKINTESKNENSKQKNDVITSQSLDEKLAEEIMNQANKDRPHEDKSQKEDKKLIEEQKQQLLLLQEQLQQQQQQQQQQQLQQQKQQILTPESKTDKKVENSKPEIAKEPEKILSCEDGNDPWIGTPVDSFKPPKGSSAVDARKWRQSVDKMMTELKSQKIGGSPLRAYITEEVNKLELLRLELFCPYLKPKTAST